MSEGGYIQGAGDDSEGWAFGLTPPVFWENQETIFNTAEEDLPSLIKELVEKHHQEAPVEQGTLIKPTNNLYFGKSDAGNRSTDSFDLVIDCNADPHSSEDPQCLNLGLAPGKIGSRNLRKILDKVESFIVTKLEANASQSVMVRCDSGKDLSAGVALAVICLFYDDQGTIASLKSLLVPYAEKTHRNIQRVAEHCSQQAVYPSAACVDSIVETRCESIARDTPICQLVPDGKTWFMNKKVYFYYTSYQAPGLYSSSTHCTMAPSFSLSRESRAAIS